VINKHCNNHNHKHHKHNTMPDSEKEDDYMSMAFLTEGDTTGTAAETSLQRRQRLRREGEIRGRPKSKAELAAAVAAEREEALSRSLIDDPLSQLSAQRSKGLAMMRKMGFKGGALGAVATPPTMEKDPVHETRSKEEGGGEGETKKTDDGSGDKAKAAATAAAAPPPLLQRAVEPIRITMKEDRGGIGLDAARKRALADAVAERERVDGRAYTKQARVLDDPDAFRERSRREREARRWEAQVVAAQKVCERMEEERELGKCQSAEDAQQLRAVSAVLRGMGGEGASAEENEDEEDEKEKEEEKKKKRMAFSNRPLKSINIHWRGLVRGREEAELDRRRRYDMEQSLPTYNDEAEDPDDRMALGKGRTPNLKPAYVPVEDLEEDDEELDTFNALEPDERLRRLVAFLRAEYRYCFWCKCAYPDAEMDGCPGVTEEDHD
jgi:hypothetical protein